MTDQPPPPPGNYPPPPPPPGGYPPPPPPQGGGFPPPQAATGYPPPAPTGGPALPPEAYTSWATRVLAYIIDYIPVAILEGIGVGLLLGTRETACITDSSEYNLGEFCATGASTLGHEERLALLHSIDDLGRPRLQVANANCRHDDTPQCRHTCDYIV